MEAYRANALYDAHTDDSFGYRLLAGEARAAGEVMVEPVVGAGERGVAAGGGVSVAGESAGKRWYPLVKELAGDGIPVSVTCRVLKLSPQPYYRWLARPITDAEMLAAYRANALYDVHRDDPEFGHQLLADEARNAGERMAERTAWNICRDNGWWCVFGKKRGKNGRPGVGERGPDARGRRRLWCTATGAVSFEAGRSCAFWPGTAWSDRWAVCGDNAAMESFFGLLQKNVLNRRSWATRAQLRIAIRTWIERTYHRQAAWAG